MRVKQEAIGEETSIDTESHTPYPEVSDLPVSRGMRPALLRFSNYYHRGITVK